jgi:hypothetical protein
VGHVARMGEKMHACRVLVGESEGKRQLAKSSYRWKDNIYLREMRRGCVDWNYLAQAPSSGRPF